MPIISHMQYSALILLFLIKMSYACYYVCFIYSNIRTQNQFYQGSKNYESKKEGKDQEKIRNHNADRTAPMISLTWVHIVCNIGPKKLQVYAKDNQMTIIGNWLCDRVKYLIGNGLDARKPVFGGLWTTQAQTSLRIRAVWSAPLLFVFWKVQYSTLLHVKFSIF